MKKLNSAEIKDPQQINQEAIQAYEDYQRLKYDSNRWFTPRFAVNFLMRLMQIFGDKVTTDSKFKKEREAWILGVVLLGINKLTHLQWWLQVPENDPPDMRSMTIIPVKERNENEFHHREIEIMEITTYTDNPIDEEILRKLKNKHYIEKTGLVVYLRRDTQIADMRELAKKLEGKVKQVSDIWILGSTSPIDQSYVLFSVYPKVAVTNFDLDEEMAKIPKGDFLDIERAKGMKMELIPNVPVTKFIP